MLGIIFTGGESPPAQVARRVVDQAGRPLLIAADSGLKVVESAGLRAGWIIGDMDSLDDASKLSEYPPQRVIRHVHDKDSTDTELAFSLAIDKGCDVIWLIGGGGGRMDHIFGIRCLFERERFPIRWITDREDIRCIDAAGPDELDCRFEKNSVVSVFPLGDGCWKAKSSGLKWPLDGVLWNRGFFGLSNVAVDGNFSIKAESGRFMVILPLPV